MTPPPTPPERPLTVAFGSLLRQWRRERSVSQRDLAARVGIDFTYLSKIENGRMPAPSEPTIRAMAKELGRGSESDLLFRLASKIPSDVKPIITSSREAPALLRAIEGLSDAEVRILIDEAERMKSMRTSTAS